MPNKFTIILALIAKIQFYSHNFSKNEVIGKMNSTVKFLLFHFKWMKFFRIL